MDKEIRKELIEIKAEMRYMRRMLEDLTMGQTDRQNIKKMVGGQIDQMRAMFSKLPIAPELKENFEKIFDSVRE